MTTLQGDCRDTLKTIPSGTIQCCVTSPPYWGLRSYLPKGHPDKHREIGQEKTPEEFVATMVDVFREVRRCLHSSGTIFLNLGDSFYNGRCSVSGLYLRKDLTGRERQYAANELFKVWKAGIERKGEGYVQTLLSPSLHEAQQAEGACILQELLQKELEAYRASHQRQEEGSPNGNDSSVGREVCLLRGDTDDISLSRPHKRRRSERVSKKQPAPNCSQGDGGRIAEGQIQDSLLELQFGAGDLRLLSSLEFNVAEIPNSLQGYFCETGAIKPKDLCMIPWRVALALQADGWYLRSVICWVKKSCMPESVTDRPTNSWEPIFLLAKNSSYFYDAFAVRERGAESSVERYKYEMMVGAKERNGGGRPNDAANTPGMKEYTGYRNQRNVWHLGPEPFSDAHFATFPSEIPKRAIMAGTSERGCCPECFAPWVRVVERDQYKPEIGKRNVDESRGDKTRKISGKEFAEQVQTRSTGWRASCTCGREDTIPCTVLDPFLGSGTVGKVAQDLGRRWIGCELNSDYSEMQARRTAQMGLIL
jgi:DNA modification methylase